MLTPKATLIGRDEIQKRVQEMAREISRAHDKDDQLVVICVLKGAVIFASDLVRHLDLPLSMDFIAVESYGQSTKSSGIVKITRDTEADFTGRHVLLVEDIVDTGLTLRYLVNHLSGKNPASLEVAVLLDKVSRREVPVTVTYRGFEIPDAFVVGYGLDFAGRYRNLPDVVIVGEDEA